MIHLKNLKVYIAAPFFNEEQLEVVKDIENILEHYNVDYFSPRSEGTIKAMSIEEKAKYMRGIYNSNIMHMEKANVMIAVIDNYDTGTVFELGYFTCMKSYFPEREIITVSNKDYNLNVMLKFSVNVHVKGMQALKNLISDIDVEGLTDNLLEIYNNPQEVVE